MSTLYVNGNLIPDGGEVYINSSKATNNIYVNSVLVWLNTLAPNAPTSFVATDNQTGQVTTTWVNSTVGVPAPTYDLYEAGTSVATDISSGYVRSVSAGTRSYYVRAVNATGTADSNTDDGTST